MTIMGGQHTIAEVEDLMKTVEFRIQAGNKTNAQITMTQIVANQPAYADLQADWNAFQVRWATGRDPITKNLLLRALASPLVPTSLQVAEDAYQQVLKLITVNSPGPYIKGDLMDVLTRIEQFSGQQINEKNAPMPTGFDPDLLAYKTLDSGIKTGEAAAIAATKAAGTVSFMMPWWVYVGGAIGAAVAAKVYLGPLIPSFPKKTG